MDDGHGGSVFPRRRVMAVVESLDKLREQLPDRFLFEGFVAFASVGDKGVQVSAFA